MLFYYLIWCRKRGGRGVRGVRGVRELGYSSLKFSVIVLIIIACNCYFYKNILY